MQRPGTALGDDADWATFIDDELPARETGTVAVRVPRRPQA